MDVWLSLILLTRVFLTHSKFLVPSEESPYDEVFQYDEFSEYVISSQALEWDQAAAVCRYAFDGVLATLETDDLLRFAAQAMAESSMNLDGLWVGLQRIEDSFKWLDLNITVPDSQFVKCGNNSLTLFDATCGAFVRANHTIPCLVSLQCEANRGFICKRPDKNDPTHHGWIKVGYRLYKIFSKQMTYDEASKACMDQKLKANLAVVETCKHAQILGRYLLIGRPSLERVWIGARWDDDFCQYEFEPEPISLSNSTTNHTCRYPPWRRGRMTKPFGCLLLDRHLSNITYFIASNCSRLHSYMCYKMANPDNPIDVCNVGDYDWRIYYKQLNWFEASDKCKKSAKTGRLPVIERKDLKYFIYIMESSKRYLLHVWLGAYFDDGAWTWSYTNRTLPHIAKKGYPPWVVNASYTKEVEKHNLCLNIDRENALVALFYGTLCSYPQSFVCQYDKGTICNNVSTTEGLPETTVSTEWPTLPLINTTKSKFTTTTKTKSTTTTTRRTTIRTRPTTTKTKSTTTRTRRTTSRTRPTTTKTKSTTRTTRRTTSKTRFTTTTKTSTIHKGNTTEGTATFTNTTMWLSDSATATTTITVRPSTGRTRTTKTTRTRPTRTRPTKIRPTRTRPTTTKSTRTRSTKHTKRTKSTKGHRKSTTEGYVILTTTPPWLLKRVVEHGNKHSTFTVGDYITTVQKF